MNKKSNLIILISVLLFFSVTVYSQKTEIRRYMIIRTAPNYTLQFNLNYNQSLLELMGAYNDDVRSEYIYSGQTFGSDKGFGASVISKIKLDNLGRIRFTQMAAYNRLLSYTFGDKTTLADHGKANYHSFTGGLGMEYNFTPAHRFKIYLGGELNASVISGKAIIWIDDPGYGYKHIGDYRIKNSFRMGYALTVGSEYLVNRNFGLNVGARLLNLNAFLRKAEGNNSDTEFQLRDAYNPGLLFAGNKNFSFYSIMAGVSYYYGIGEKRYKLK